MKVKIIAELKEIKNGAAAVHCSIAQEHGVSILLPVVFEAMLKAMKDTDKRAFYAAMANFAAHDFDDLNEFIDGECDND